MPRSPSLLPLVALLVLLAGCTLGPNYLRPAPMAVIPDDYKEMQGWKVGTPAEGLLPEAWWQLFNDPQLDALEGEVAAANQTVVAAVANLRQARAVSRAARAGLLPQVGVGASYSHARHSANQGASSSAPESSDYQLPAEVAWELDLWGRVQRTVEASEANSQAQAAELGAVLLGVRAELAADYLALRVLDEDKRLLDDQAAQADRFLDLTKNRYASGVAAKADVLQAETQLKAIQAQALDVTVQRAQLEHAIAGLIGQPPASFSLAPIAPEEGLPALPALPVAVPSELLERRPDITRAERQMASANAQIGVAEAAFFPTVRLSASAGLEADSLAPWLTWPSRFWALGPAVSETVFDGGLRRAQSEQAWAAYEATVASYRQTVLTGFQEVEDNLAALRILGQEAGIQDEALTAAKASSALVKHQYQAGTASALNVLVARQTELSAERAALTIRGRRLAASLGLIKALGGGWQGRGTD